MPLEPGRRLGPYEIVAPLGAGGMGEVYEAKDTRLGRTVAIKVLPEGLAESPERRARFEREARTVSQLTHPHVCTLHDVGEEEGIHFLVLEHCEGETLAQRLERGAFSLEDTLRYGAQIAEALDAAHRRGVVHRDLKPANVMLTSTGVKLLDFGLARLAAEEAGEVADLPTMTMGAGRDLTEEGTVLGTFPYMSPEQVEGAEADARSDIFSLGAVLYEMATGQRAFQGKSAASVMAAVLRSEPEPLSKVQPVSPPALDHVVSRCLAKDPERRWQTARDVAEELRWIREVGSQAGVAVPVARRRKSWERLAWGIATVALLGFVAITVAWLLRASPTDPLVTRSLVSLPPELAGGPGGSWDISPDGRTVVMALYREGERQLFLRHLDSLETLPLEGTESAYDPFFSPDGEWIAYFQEDELRKIPVRGGAPLTLARGLPGNASGADWYEEDTILFSSWRSAGVLWRVPATGGEPEEIRPETEQDFLYSDPEVLPDSRTVLVGVGPGSFAAPRIGTLDLETRELAVLFEGSDHTYLPPGYLVFKSLQGALMVAPFDLEQLALTAEPLAALDEDRVQAYVVSPNGVLIYDAPGLDTHRPGELVWIDRNEGIEPLGLPPADFGTLGIARKTLRVAASIEDPDGPDKLHLVDLEREAIVPLPNPENANSNPTWSPDATTLVFTSWSDGIKGRLFVLRLGIGTPELLLEDPENTLVVEDWHPDGSVLLLEVHPWRGGNADLFTVSLEGEPELHRLLSTSAHEETARFSPDGNFMAFTSDHTGREEVYLAPYPEVDRQWQVSLAGGTHPRWSAAGDQILYRQDGRVLAASVSTDGNVSVGRPTTVVEGSYAPQAWDVAPDDRLLMVRWPERREHDMVLVTNWHLELEEMMNRQRR